MSKQTDKSVRTSAVGAAHARALARRGADRAHALGRQPRYRMEIAWSDEDGAYLATVPDLPGCVTHGATYVEAARMGEDAIAAWLEGARHWGTPIPEPGSGRASQGRSPGPDRPYRQRGELLPGAGERRPQLHTSYSSREEDMRLPGQEAPDSPGTTRPARKD